jgi:outer membrane protein OmpA-like peptidoglycan-associated protein
MLRSYLLLALYIFVDTAAAQKVVPCASDCNKPTKLEFYKSGYFYMPSSPNGYGAKQDIYNLGYRDKRVIEAEHHSAWFTFTCNYDGDLGFDLYPDKFDDDYDFVLYKLTDTTNISGQLNASHVVRSNLSRNSADDSGATGLNVKAANLYVGKGVGEPYAKSISVKKSDQYLLLIDNVYNNGKGFKLYLNYQKVISLNGQILDDSTGEGIAAKISLQNMTTGRKSNIPVSDKGEYDKEVALAEGTDYQMIAKADGYFFAAETINTKTVVAKVNKKTKLTKLNLNKKYKLPSMNYQGGVAILLPSSRPSLDVLYSMMMENKALKIRICGYVNGCSEGEAATKDLSEKRALVVYDYLSQKQIDKGRLEYIGYGCKFMLYPNAKNEWEMEQNRRVEIEVTAW